MIAQKFKTPMGAAAALLSIAVLVTACSSAATPVPAPATPAAPAVTQNVAGATQAPVAASQAPAAGTATVLAKTVGGTTILVAGSNGMTVYTFTKDTAGSGTSTCTGGCITKWPALTVAAGGAPSAGDGVTGKLGTLTRSDGGALQVTYNGLPLYFYSGDSAPGDTNGSYPNWNLVKP